MQRCFDQPVIGEAGKERLRSLAARGHVLAAIVIEHRRLEYVQAALHGLVRQREWRLEPPCAHETPAPGPSHPAAAAPPPLAVAYPLLRHRPSETGRAYYSQLNLQGMPKPCTLRGACRAASRYSLQEVVGHMGRGAPVLALGSKHDVLVRADDGSAEGLGAADAVGAAAGTLGAAVDTGAAACGLPPGAWLGSLEMDEANRRSLLESGTVLVSRRAAARAADGPAAAGACSEPDSDPAGGSGGGGSGSMAAGAAGAEHVAAALVHCVQLYLCLDGSEGAEGAEGEPPHAAGAAAGADRHAAAVGAPQPAAAAEVEQGARARLACTHPPPSAIVIEPATSSVLQLRDCFHARPSCVLIAADYAHAELSVVAHLARDSNLVGPALASDARLGALLARTDVDAFRLIAVYLRAEPAEARGAHAGAGSAPPPAPTCEAHGVSDAERARAKRTVYAVLYGGGNSHDVDAFFRRFPAVEAVINALRRRCRRDSYVETIAGRRRYIGLRTARAVSRADARGAPDANLNKVFNTVCQGSVADLVKLAMVEADGLEQRLGARCRMRAQLHDELIFEVAEDAVERCARAIKERMEGVGGKVRMEPGLLRVKLKVGRTWGSLHDLEVPP